MQRFPVAAQVHRIACTIRLHITHLLCMQERACKHYPKKIFQSSETHIASVILSFDFIFILFSFPSATKISLSTRLLFLPNRFSSTDEFKTISLVFKLSFNSE